MCVIKSNYFVVPSKQFSTGVHIKIRFKNRNSMIAILQNRYFDVKIEENKENHIK